MGGLLRLGVAMSWVWCLSGFGRAALGAPNDPQPSEPVLGPYRRPAPDPPPAEPAVAQGGWEDTGRHLHDGFYLRLAGGVGYAFDALEGNQPELSLSQAAGARGHAKGLAVATEVAAGLSLWRGLVLALGCETALLPAPRAAGAAGSANYRFEPSQLAVFQPFFDWYIWDHLGLHVEAGGGLAVLVQGQGTTSSGGKPVQPHTAVGPGLAVGAGYEWWIADQWSVGALGRFMYGWATGQDPLGASWTHQMGNFSLLLGATYQ